MIDKMSKEIFWKMRKKKRSKNIIREKMMNKMKTIMTMKRMRMVMT